MFALYGARNLVELLVSDHHLRFKDTHSSLALLVHVAHYRCSSHGVACVWNHLDQASVELPHEAEFEHPKTHSVGGKLLAC